MATLDQIPGIIGDGDMLQLVEAALIRKAYLIGEEAASSAGTQPNRRNYALGIITSPKGKGEPMWRYLIGKFMATADVEQITRSVGDPTLPTDTTIQDEVSAAVDKFYPTGA